MSTLRHFRYRRYLDAFVDGELADDLVPRVTAHVTECRMCARDAELTEKVKQRLARWRGSNKQATTRVKG